MLIDLYVEVAIQIRQAQDTTHSLRTLKSTPLISKSSIHCVPSFSNSKSKALNLKTHKVKPPTTRKNLQTPNPETPKAEKAPAVQTQPKPLRDPLSEPPGLMRGSCLAAFGFGAHFGFVASQIARTSPGLRVSQQTADSSASASAHLRLHKGSRVL